MRVAVIGVGRMGSQHARLYGERLVAVCDRDAARARAIGDFHGVRSYADPAELLATEAPDAVSVATPIPALRAAAAAALEAGVHVLVEKPMADGAAAAQELVDLARRRGVTLAVGYHNRFNAAVEFVRGRRLGAPLAIETLRRAPRPERLGAGADVLVEQSIHDIDIARHLTGAEVVSATARGGAGEARVELELEGGGRLVSDARWEEGPMRRELRISGSGGEAVVRLTERAAGGRDADGPFEVRFDDRNALADELADFLDCARTGRRPRVPGEEGVANLLVLERL